MKAQELASVPAADFEKIKTGKKSRAAATRSIRQRKNKRRLEKIAAKIVPKADRLYDVIVIDPPWPMEKVEREVRPSEPKNWRTLGVTLSVE